VNRHLKQFLILLIQSILFWIVAFTVFAIFRYYGFNEEYIGVIPLNAADSVLQWLDVPVFTGIIVGFAYAIIEFFFDKFIANKLALWETLLFKIILYGIVLIFTASFAFDYVEYLMDTPLANDSKYWWFKTKVFWATTLYFFISSLIFSFIKIANVKFGKGVFINMLLGKYRKPKEEHRIFMFLDLKNSTQIAEQLGHYTYSQFIQDCFLDLNKILNKYDAEVYQYVGDEAVLTWKYTKGIKKSRCVKLFFAFQKQLLKRNSYYHNRYATVPIFKAGLHGGKLMVAEVGTVKKELAFHGDVINTTARVQAQCNTYSESLLISESLLESLQLNDLYNSKAIGSISLKGKQQKVSIYGLNE